MEEKGEGEKREDREDLKRIRSLISPSMERKFGRS